MADDDGLTGWLDAMGTTVLPEATATLIIYTGGTFGCETITDPNDPKKTIQVLRPSDVVLERVNNLLGNEVQVDAEEAGGDSDLVWFGFDPGQTIDSTNATPETWELLARIIHSRRRMYRAFVVIHGTDSLAYTSAALAYLLPGLTTPVVVTGAQINVFEDRGDAMSNLVNAINFTRHNFVPWDNQLVPFPGVTVCFGDKVMVGTRVTKVHSSFLDAFDSPNLAPIATFPQTDSSKLAPIAPVTDLDVAMRFLGVAQTSTNVVWFMSFQRQPFRTSHVFFDTVPGWVTHNYGAGLRNGGVTVGAGLTFFPGNPWPRRVIPTGNRATIATFKCVPGLLSNFGLGVQFAKDDDTGGGWRTTVDGSVAILDEEMQERLDTVWGHIDGIVVEGYGLGNIPDDMRAVLRFMVRERHVPVVVITDCHQGSVEGNYAVSVDEATDGFCPLSDLVVEAAYSLMVITVSNVPNDAARVRTVYERVKETLTLDRDKVQDKVHSPTNTSTSSTIMPRPTTSSESKSSNPTNGIFFFFPCCGLRVTSQHCLLELD